MVDMDIDKICRTPILTYTSILTYIPILTNTDIPILTNTDIHTSHVA